jgi:uncharacterized protein with PIN domain
VSAGIVHPAASRPITGWDLVHSKGRGHEARPARWQLRCPACERHLADVNNLLISDGIERASGLATVHLQCPECDFLVMLVLTD